VVQSKGRTSDVQSGLEVKKVERNHGEPLISLTLGWCDPRSANQTNLDPDRRFRPAPLRSDGRQTALARETQASAVCLHYAGRVDEGEDGEDDVLGERSPSGTKACELGVNRCQIMPTGAGVALLRRC
jgi:hypothetical protein